MDNLDCYYNDYLTVLQCSYSTHIDSGCDNSYDATVYCCEFADYYDNMLLLIITDTTRIWDSNPYSGMIRLQGGTYTNLGRVEVYFNGQWGTICDDGFNSTDALVLCKQLGYNGYIKYNQFTL